MCRLASRQKQRPTPVRRSHFPIRRDSSSTSAPPLARRPFPAPPPRRTDWVAILLAGALEAEEVGVEHLLRDINDPSVSSLANQVKRLAQTKQGGRAPSGWGVG